MKFYKYLYIGDNVNKVFSVKKKLQMHAGVNVYVITIAQGEDQLEFFHASYLKQKYYRKHPPVIVGIAENYEEAVGIITEITGDCVKRMGNADLKEYLKCKAKTKNFENEA